MIFNFDKKTFSFRGKFIKKIFFQRLPIFREDDGDMFLQNFCKHLQDPTASQPTRLLTY
jgi:hypothetical protein